MEKISLITSICALIITILNIISMFNKGLENNDKTREDTLNYRLTTDKGNKIYLNKSKVLIIYRILIKRGFNCK